MRIKSLECINWLSHNRIVLDMAPMTIVCGPNGSGKSSLGDAISFAMLAELRRIEGKGERERLITRGQSAGVVCLKTGEAGEHVIQRDVASGKLSQAGGTPLAADAVKAAMPVAFNSHLFATMPAEERRKLLLQVTRTDLEPEAIRKELLARGHSADHVKALPDGPVEAWPDVAKANAAEARGAWKAVTREAYGALKAETWTAPTLSIASVDPSGLEAEVETQEETLKVLTERIGAAKAYADTARASAARREKLAKEVGQAEQLRETAAAAAAAAGRATVALEAASTDLRDLRDRLPGQHQDCPHCGSTVVIVDGRLAPYSPPAKPSNPAMVAIADRAVSQARATKEAADRAQKAADDALAASVRASAELADAPADPKVEPAPLADLESRAAGLRHDLAANRDKLTKIHAAASEMAKAQRATADARDHHEAVKAWTALEAAVSSAGIPSELLGRSLKAFNDVVAAEAVAVGWKQVAVHPDMSIAVDGHPYGLSSESEQWRADAILSVVVSSMAKIGAVVLDRFDVLDIPARQPALGWLYGLTDGVLDTVLLLGTLKAPPAVPGDVTVCWLGAPVAVKAAA